MIQQDGVGEEGGEEGRVGGQGEEGGKRGEGRGGERARGSCGMGIKIQHQTNKQTNKQTPSWLEEMIGFPIWREVFCQLSEQVRTCVTCINQGIIICSSGPVITV